MARPYERCNGFIRKKGIGTHVMGIKKETKPLAFIEDANTPKHLPNISAPSFEGLVKNNGTKAAM